MNGWDFTMKIKELSSVKQATSAVTQLANSCRDTAVYSWNMFGDPVVKAAKQLTAEVTNNKDAVAKLRQEKIKAIEREIAATKQLFAEKMKLRHADVASLNNKIENTTDTRALAEYAARQGVLMRKINSLRIEYERRTESHYRSMQKLNKNFSTDDVAQDFGFDIGGMADELRRSKNKLGQNIAGDLDRYSADLSAAQERIRRKTSPTLSERTADSLRGELSRLGTDLGRFFTDFEKRAKKAAKSVTTAAGNVVGMKSTGQTVDAAFRILKRNELIDVLTGKTSAVKRIVGFANLLGVSTKVTDKFQDSLSNLGFTNTGVGKTFRNLTMAAGEAVAKIGLIAGAAISAAVGYGAFVTHAENMDKVLRRNFIAFGDIQNTMTAL